MSELEQRGVVEISRPLSKIEVIDLKWRWIDPVDPNPFPRFRLFRQPKEHDDLNHGN